MVEFYGKIYQFTVRKKFFRKNIQTAQREVHYMNGGAFDDHYNFGFIIFVIIDCIAFITSFVHFRSSMFRIIISRCLMQFFADNLRQLSLLCQWKTSY